MKSVESVDEYILKSNYHKDILMVLREILNSTGLIETIKWNAPVYTLDGKNVVGMGTFKSYAGLWFFQGALLADKKKKLINAQEGKTNAQRQWRFESVDEIDRDLILDYLNEAIQNQKDGKEIKPSRNKELVIPPELQDALAENQELNVLFQNFSLSHKREYAEYINEAKREETRKRRLGKVISMIIRKEGLNDKYR